MSITLADLPTKVLRELRVIGGDEAPDAQDQALVLEMYGWWLAEARRDWNVNWDSDDDIPDGAEQGVVWLMAERCAVSFAKPNSDRRQFEGERLIRAAVRRLPTYEPQRTDHF